MELGNKLEHGCRLRPQIRADKRAVDVQAKQGDSSRHWNEMDEASKSGGGSVLLDSNLRTFFFPSPSLKDPEPKGLQPDSKAPPPSLGWLRVFTNALQLASRGDLCGLKDCGRAARSTYAFLTVAIVDLARSSIALLSSREDGFRFVAVHAEKR